MAVVVVVARENKKRVKSFDAIWREKKLKFIV
jgi:hypothetical protein